MTVGGSPPLARVDLRLVPAAAATWLGALFGLWAARPAVLVVAAVALAAGLVAACRLRAAVGAALAVAGVCAATAMSVATWRLAVVHGGPLAAVAADRAVVVAEAVVAADPVPVRPTVVGNTRAPDEVAVRVDLRRAEVRGSVLTTSQPVLVVAPARGWDAVLPGQLVRVFGRFRPAEPADDVTAVLLARGPPHLLAPAGAMERVAATVREHLRAATAGLPPAEAGLVAGLVDGDTVLLPAATKDEFRTAGLTHLTAVSGANLAYVAAAALVTARWAGLRGYAVQVAGLAALAAFVVVARPEPSVVRAAAMAVLTTLAALRGGRRAGGGSGVLAASVVLLLLVDPFLARSAGFALSALATGGLVLLAPGWRQRLARRLPSPVADAVAVSLAAQVATWPVLVLLTPQLSLVSVPANLLAAVAVPAATLLGVGAALTSLVLPAVGAVLARLAALPAGWIVGVAHVCAGLPLAAVPWLPGVPGALALVGAMVLARTAAPAVFRRPPLLLGLAAGAALLVPGSPLRPTGWPPHDWVMVACDVGQGDALVVPVEAGTALVVDAGPDPRAVDRCLRDLGVSRVPLVVLTHFHADHVEGLPGVLDGRRVAEVEVSPLPDPPDEVRRVRGWAQAAGVPVVVAHAGEQRSDGSVSWTVLGPRRLVPGGSPPNNASVVLRVQTHGLVLLLTGDVEPEAQGLLLADPGSLRADVLKVPHHGSANQDPAFLRAVGASVALVSVGVGNPYGHPAPSTLAALAGLGMVVGRTDEDGDLAVVPVDGHPALVPRHPP